MLDDTDLFSCLVDELSELLGTIDDMVLVGILLSNLLPHLGVLPRGRHVEFSPPFELLFSLDVGIIDPLSVRQRISRSHG